MFSITLRFSSSGFFSLLVAGTIAVLVYWVLTTGRRRV
jgi:hypothetical protein